MGLSLLLALLPGLHARALEPPPCAWHDYLRSDAVTSWELQLDVPPARTLAAATRKEFVDSVLAALQQAADANGSSALMLRPRSLRTSVFLQTSHALSTLDGHPLPGFSDAAGSSRHYFWQKVAFIKRVVQQQHDRVTCCPHL